MALLVGGDDIDEAAQDRILDVGGSYQVPFFGARAQSTCVVNHRRRARREYLAWRT
jgi:hypothetical protein